MSGSLRDEGRGSPAGTGPRHMGRVCSNGLALGAFLILVCICVLSAVAPWLVPHDPNHVRIELSRAAPGADYLLGGDSAGRDLLSRLLIAGRFTLVGSALATGVALALGAVGGLLAGHFGRSFDAVSSWVVDGLLVLPPTVILIALFSSFGSSMHLAMLALGVLLSPLFFRLTRSLVMGVAGELYIDAARVSGVSEAGIIRRHVLPNVVGPVIVQSAVVAALAMLLQSGLEFLGFGDGRTPSWGGMLYEAFPSFYTSPLTLLWPGLAITLTVGALMLFANAMRDSVGRASALRHSSALAPRPTRTRGPVQQPAFASTERLLSVHDLRVCCGVAGDRVEVVQGVSFEVRRAETLGIVGESGAGKTLTAFALLGLLDTGCQVTQGSMVFEGAELTTLSQAERRRIAGTSIAYVPQDPMKNLDPFFRVGAQLLQPMASRLGLRRRAARAHLLELFSRVGIADPNRVFRSYPHELSGGTAQRCLIAAAVACNPKLLIADEVTSALDASAKTEVLELLRSLQQQSGMAIICITHDFDVVSDFCDRVAVMRDGRVVEAGRVDRVTDHAQHPYTRLLLDSRVPAPVAQHPHRRPVATPPLLSVRDLSVSYPAQRPGRSPLHVLTDVSLDISAGETVGLVGPSGAGKSTLGRAVLGLTPPRTGTVTFEGTDVTHVAPQRRAQAARLQAIFQDPFSSLNPSLTIEQTLSEPFRAAKTLGRAQSRAKAFELLDRVHLPRDVALRVPAELSGGQRQRVAIARAFAHSPRLIICDEPVSSLDLATQSRILQLFAELQRDTGVAYLFISHDLAAVHYLSDRLLIMSEGRLTEATGRFEGDVQLADRGPGLARDLV